jgi:hypothetical protein
LRARQRGGGARSPPAEFIVFPGDEMAGLAADPDALRARWRHWLDVEMRWLDRDRIPLWHCTGNHTAYDTTSEAVFLEVLDLPRNGPPGQDGLSYWVRYVVCNCAGSGREEEDPALCAMMVHDRH